MTVPIQNPDATTALLEFYDILGKLSLRLDDVISPIAIVDDGWRRVTYILTDDLTPQSTAAHDVAICQGSPDFMFQVIHLNVAGTGNLADVVHLKLEPQFQIPADLRWATITLTGVLDPDEIGTNEFLESIMPIAPPNTSWDVRAPTTGVGETFRVRAVVAQIPRGMRPL